ncbi:CHAT domain-containing protein [uncultured Dokdonia sp.]|uniref:CHAT domain-containing protein n=1 Tax=uncultured Dokdonia sp. TaxID=575653 RepID=UPI002621094C|nr:CHAT domain-containing protein [uncultured Dokdonia sp.]
MKRKLILTLNFLILSTSFIYSQDIEELSRLADSLQFKEFKNEEALKIRKKVLQQPSETDSLYGLNQIRYWSTQGSLAIQSNEIEKGLTYLDSVWQYKEMTPSNEYALDYLTSSVANYYVTAFPSKGVDFCLDICEKYIVFLESKNASASIIQAIYSDLGFLHNFSRNYKASSYYNVLGIELMQKEKEVDSSLISEYYNWIGSNYSDQDILDKSLKYYKKGVAFGLNSDIKDPYPIIHKLGNYINEVLLYGDYDEALKILHILKQKQESWLGSEFLGHQFDPHERYNSIIMTKLYYHLPFLRYYAQTGNVDKAVATFQKMKELKETLTDKRCDFLEPYSLAALKMEMIWTLEEKKIHLKEFTEEMKVSNCTHNYSVAKFMLGKAYFTSGDYKIMNQEFEDIAIEGASYFKTFQARVKSLRAQAAFKTGNKNAFVLQLNEAIVKLMKDSSDIKKERLFSASFEKENSAHTINLLLQISNDFDKLYQATKDTTYLYRKVDLSYIAAQKFNQLYKDGLFNANLERYIFHINQNLLDHQELFEDTSELVNLIENNLSQHLTATFNQKRNTHVEVPENLDILKDVIDIKIEAITSEAIVDYPENIGALQKTADSIKTVIQQLQDKKNIVSTGTWSVNTFQNTLSEDQCIIRYVLGDQTLFGIRIEKDHISMMPLGSREKIIALIDTQRSTIFDRTASYKQTFKELYQLLLAPLLKDLKNPSQKHFTFITQNELSYVPFAALINPEDKFLIESNTVSTAFSLPLLDIQKELKANGKRLGVFAPIYAHNDQMPDDLIALQRSGFYELPFAQEESKEISALFDGDLYTGDRASKEMFIKEKENYDILHLAMHALSASNDSEQSSLVFSQNERLLFDELYTYNIPAQLAVLSACNTGTGILKEGEDLQSLSRAFTYAGTNSTLTSLWNVNDQSTKEIMKSFYHNLKNGDSKHIALRKANLTYLNSTTDETLKHPYYWAAFTLSGNTAPITQTSHVWWYVIGGLLLLVLMYTLSRKRTKTNE